MTIDEIKGFHINSDGYGIIPKSVMQNQKLSISAKAVYAYFCSFTGAGNTCFPSRSKICYDLGISNNSLSKYIKELTSQSYIKVEQVKENGRFSYNVYTLPDVKKPYTKICDTENLGDENLHTKNNSFKNNSFKTNISDKKKERKKPTGYDAILSKIEDDSLKDLYYEYIKMRKLIKSPMTDRALTMLINKVVELEPESVDRQKQMLEIAIMNNWKSVYPLKEQQKAVNKPDSVYDDLAGITQGSEFVKNNPELEKEAEELKKKLQEAYS